MKTRFLAIPLVGLLAAASAQGADMMTATSADGAWKGEVSIANPMAVKQKGEARGKVMASSGKACPMIASAAFEMPAHGHGGSLAPALATGDGCSFVVTDLEPTMGGEWRLRLVLREGGKSTNLDFSTQAK